VGKIFFVTVVAYLKKIYDSRRDKPIICTIVFSLQIEAEKLQRNNQIHNKHKGKAVPLQAWSGPEGSRKLRFPDFMTTAQGGGKVVSLTHRPPLPPGNAPATHFC